ncbi:MAG: menaquinone biosynthesis decarboxylase, partial [Acidobacteriota bacterium]|nr:menaquinone biosynthesis decarboxylase [Acidobacteriota bacterium]
MAYDDLREFIRALDKNKELKRISVPADTKFEITEFADRSVKNGGPALLFEKPGGKNMPLLINSFASMKRMEIALQVDSVDEVAKRISEYLEMRMPEGLLGKLKMLPKLAEMGAFFPKIVSKGACQEVVKHDGFSLHDLPVLTCWPDDGGPFITLPMVFTRNPETGKRNCGMYRMQVYDERTTGMHWQTHKQGAEHFRRRFAEGQTRMDVSVAIGSDPATMYSAILPLPPDLDEMMIAGFLRGSPVEMVKCQTNDLEVPANAEIVLEGYVELGESRLEGPFGDHTGYYSLADRYPVFHVTCVTHRKDPIYATTIVGPPPMEDFYMGKAIERIFLPLMRMQIPEVRDMCMPAEGVFHNLMLISIRKSYPGHARKVMSAIWGLGQAMFTKCIVVVDEDVDVQNYSEVAWRALNNIDPERDVQFTMGPIDSLDHASRLVNYGSKMGIDATRKWPGEGFTREWPE